jgi:phosphate transport system substrate-binding protein
MRQLKSIILLMVLISGLSCKTSNPVKESTTSGDALKTDLKGSITIGGAYALSPLVSKWAEEFMKINPGVEIEVTKTGTGKGINDLLTKNIQIAMISRPLTEEELNAGIWTIPVAKDGVAPIVNQKNPYLGKLLKQGLSQEEFLKAFTSDKPVTWGELLDTAAKDKLIVFSRADESGAAVIMADFLYKKQSDLSGIKVTGDEEMIKSIQGNPMAIGFCNFSFAFNPFTGERVKDIQVIPFDLDFDNKIERKETPFSNLEMAHRSIWLGLYPDDLCRELLIGTLGKPTDKCLVAFIKYILTDGQSGIKEAGLCALNDVYLKYSLDNLK